MNLKISVIIPTYNRADLALQTIKSVFEQSYNNFEIIVIDDGSTDDTRKVLSQFERHQNFQYHYQENSGRSRARNNGMNKASGEYLMFLDSDDLLLPQGLETLIEAARKFPESGVIGGGRLFINDEMKVLEVNDELLVKNDILDSKVYTEKIRSFFLPPSTYIIKKSLALKLNGYDAEFEPCEDYDFFLRYCDAAKISVLKKKVVHMRRHEGNTTGQNIFDGSLKVSLHNFEMLKNNPQNYPTDILRKMKTEWQLKMADDFYVTGDNRRAFEHYVKAIKIAPEILFRKNVLKSALGSYLPQETREKLKAKFGFGTR